AGRAPEGGAGLRDGFRSAEGRAQSQEATPLMDERMREELLRQVQEAISAAWNITEQSARETLAHYRKQQRQRWHAGGAGPARPPAPLHREQQSGHPPGP